ncbi:hypothetical protein [Micromonospora yangpuensis]|uniref:Uncharacterized protein n=1 Tax=Micromonospora yangpuensis TaxID=683228 RepID=A0A1C6TYT6_9ACTN|nr:hypothetical protein [Micromonospora yangpuensis]GGM20754.1 hypothetical protein GCM10012279_43970 [Micromonospora yangpuensis]SCL47000.1 hypothetical protein GA0070617_0447 [Micromonospora yangpuensis]
MEKIELLCAGAEALLDRDDYGQESASLLDRADQLLVEAGRGAEEVDELLQAALGREQEASAADSKAERVLSLAETDLRDPAQVLDVADATNRQVRAVLVDEQSSVEVRHLKLRVRAARDKIQSLRSRLPQS